MGLILGIGVERANAADEMNDPLSYRVTVESPVSASSDDRYWFQARVGAVAPNHCLAELVLTAQLIDRQGSHLYHGLVSWRSHDLGKTWQGPAPQAGLDRRTAGKGLLEVPADMTPFWHQKTGKLLLTGVTFLLNEKRKSFVLDAGSSTAYSVYDASTRTWSEYRKLKMPEEKAFGYARAGCSQAWELPDGDILLPIYFKEVSELEHFKTTVVRCRFDGKTLRYLDRGNDLELPIKRGLYEPSLTKFRDTYYLTLRNDDEGYLATSSDGLHFGPPRKWKFDDGSPLGSANTQQHWVTHSDALFLAYTRKNADNEEVFRNRAPLFMAEVDRKTGALIRSTETILLPKVGTSEFGNFGVGNVDANETWVTAGRGDAKSGEPSIYIARIQWSKPNRLAPQPHSLTQGN